MARNPENGKPYERDDSSDLPTTRKQRVTEELLVEMTHALQNNNKAKADRIATELVNMWND